MSIPEATATPAAPAEMTIHRAGTTIAPGPKSVASGEFWGEVLLNSGVDGECTVTRATFAPGSITHWHTHPLGQILYAISGVGQVQRAGGDVHEIRPGDCVWFAPNERHWHGAAPHSVFIYVSIQRVQHGAYVQWLDPVAAPAAGVRKD
jgi:quercetin dioxygenase-like cupin family protein